MKIYRNHKDTRTVGIKFDDLASTQVLLTATGALEDEVKVSISYRNRDLHGDFNADPDYVKDYDADMTWVVSRLLDACDHDREDKFGIRFIEDNGTAKVIGIRKDASGMDFNALVDRVNCFID